MKISVSLPEEDVAYLDHYAARAEVGSRSAAVHEAVLMLRASALEDAYQVAWTEWEDSGDADLWDSAAADAITDASR